MSFNLKNQSFGFDDFVFVLLRFLASLEGLGTYGTLSTFLPGLSLALLYMTVLSFDSVTRGKLSVKNRINFTINFIF